jgi:hypothetical protein
MLFDDVLWVKWFFREFLVVKKKKEKKSGGSEDPSGEYGVLAADELQQVGLV